MTEQTREEILSDVELSLKISEAEKLAHEARLAEVDVQAAEFELLETQLNLDYQLSGEYSFFDKVNDKSVRSMLRQIRIWHKYKSTGDWVINLNSVGGEAFQCAAMFDELYSRSKIGGGDHHITIKVRGLAASAAGILLQAADDRVIGKSSQIMIHESAGGVVGRHSEIAAEANWHDRFLDQMLDIFLSRTDRITRAQLRRKIVSGRDWYLTADEALHYGFVDRIG